MNSFWKGVSLTIILIFGLFVAYNIYMDYSQPLNESEDTNQKQYQRQVEIFDQQAKKHNVLQAETERQLKESARQQEFYDSHLKRMGVLLERWEKQADRYDAILEKWENQIIFKSQ